MSPLYLNSPLPSSHVPFNQDLCSNHNLSYTILENTHDHHHHHLHHHYHHEALSLEYSWNPQDKVDKALFYNHKSSDVGDQSSTWPQNYMMDGSGCSYVHSSSSISHGKIKIVTNNKQKNSKKWKPSKPRIMQKMPTTSSKNTGGIQHDPEPRRHRNNLCRNNNNNGVRVCVDCNTTTTPLWRSGPQGPKTLCNACGIRQRKARRAAMAAVSVTESSPSSSVSMEMRETILHPLPLKKRGNMNNNDNRYIKAMSQRGFPRDDEEEGAILLMALSCGLACSS